MVHVLNLERKLPRHNSTTDHSNQSAGLIQMQRHMIPENCGNNPNAEVQGLSMEKQLAANGMANHQASDHS